MVDAGIPIVSVAAKFTTAPHAFPGASTVIVFGTSIEGATASITTILNVVVAILPDASLAITFTVVVPIGNIDPLAGVATILTKPEQLSVAVGVI